MARRCLLTTLNTMRCLKHHENSYCAQGVLTQAIDVPQSWFSLFADLEPYTSHKRYWLSPSPKFFALSMILRSEPIYPRHTSHGRKWVVLLTSMRCAIIKHGFICDSKAP